MDTTRTFAQELGARLFRTRLKQNIDLHLLAVVKNWSAAEVQAWECGKAIPTIEQLRDLAIIYRVSLDYLVCGTSALEPDIASQEPAFAPVASFGGRSRH